MGGHPALLLCVSSKSREGRDVLKKAPSQTCHIDHYDRIRTRRGRRRQMSGILHSTHTHTHTLAGMQQEAAFRAGPSGEVNVKALRWGV